MKKPSKFSSKYRSDQRRHNLRRILLIGLTVLVVASLFLVPYIYGKAREFRRSGAFGQVVRPSSSASTVALGSSPATLPATGAPAGTALTVPAQTSPSLTAGSATTTTPATLPSTVPAQTSSPLTTTPATTAPVTKAIPADAQAAGYALSNGTAIRILYKQAPDGRVEYFGARDGEGQYSYDISPDGSKILINETAAQNLVIIGQSMVAQDHSFNLFYHKSRGALTRVENRDDGFVWMRNARFFSEERILFESQVSNEWKRLYIRYLDLADNKSRVIAGSWARSAQLLGPVAGGYAVSLDGVIATITPDLKVIGRKP